MTDVFVVEALRTPLGSFGGSLADVAAPRLAAAVIERLVADARLDPAAIGEVVLGEVLTAGVKQAPARQALRAARLPDSIPALTVNKVCGSGLEAIVRAAASIRAGEAELALAGGMESMSRAPYLLPKARSGYRLGHGELLDALVHDGLEDAYDGRHMGAIADAAAERHGIGRAQQDELAIRSYRLAQRAVQEGLFAGEIAPVKKASKGGEEIVERDEEPFRVDLARLPKLRPAFTEQGTVTAGNASTLSDGAALALLASERALKTHGLRPRARLVSAARFATAPHLYTDAPVGAIRAACARAAVAPGDVDLYEVNEAFSLVPLIAVRELGLPLEKVNVNGGAVALGHPIGASGARVVATLIAELHRRGARRGLATLCIGGGEAIAAVFERT